MANKIIFIAGFFVLIATGVLAQNKYLQKKIDIHLNNTSLSKALSEIELKAGFNFSYSSGLFRPDSIVSVNANQVPVNEIIYGLLGNQIEMIESGNHVILKQGSKDSGTISGKVINYETKATVGNAQIRQNQNIAAKTNRKGTFSIVCSEFPCYVEVSANGFRDTSLAVNKKSNSFVVELQPVTKEPDVLFRAPANRPEVISNSSTNDVNIADAFLIRPLTDSIEYKELESKNMQFSLLPFIGTDLVQSPNYKYSYSFNLIGGYIGSLSGVEIGTVMNIVKQNALGFQFAGLLNIVNGSLSGNQISPGVNMVFNNVYGVQVAGISNFCRNEFYGIQFAVIHNTLQGNSKGVQAAIISNLSSGVLNGTQFACITNISSGKFVHSQVSGIANFAAAESGMLQFACIYNKAFEANGVQIAAISNTDLSGKPIAQFAIISNNANEISTMQFPALFNKCNVNRGLQLGLINISDSSTGVQIGLLNFSNTNDGIPIGFFTIVKNGYRAVEISANDINYLNFSYKSGLHKFYNIMNIGILPKQENFRLNLGYGIGTAVFLGKKWMLNIDLVANHAFERNSFVKNLNLWMQLKPEIGINIANTFVLFAGTSFNAMISKWKNPYTNEFLTQLPPEQNYFDKIVKNTKYTLWQGFTVGVRF